MLSRITVLLALLCAATTHATVITVQDDTQHTITLPAPAHRIVSLAPHTTELLFAAGAGAYVVGASTYSDYPSATKKIPSVGAIGTLDIEKIAALKPDLVVAWSSGNATAQINTLRTLGIPVFNSEPRDFSAMASSLERLAKLAGTEATGNPAAAHFRQRLAALRSNYRQRSPIRVFYQIWHNPLMTLNGTHMTSAVIRLCGGQNVFDNLPQLAPTVSIEAVLQANPEVIFVADTSNADWQRFPTLSAVTHNNIFTLTLDWMSRPGPRILDGAAELCQKLDIARQHRP